MQPNALNIFETSAITMLQRSAVTTRFKATNKFNRRPNRVLK